nr:hypothetical protein [Tanacetum cinerariifolium]
MSFISLAKNRSGNGEVNTTSIPTASTHVSPAGPNVATASISLDTACAYIASQSNGSQIKYEDINQIDEDDIEEMDIKWNMALLSMRANRYWKKIGKKISIQGSVGHPEAKKGVEGKTIDKVPKAWMAIDGVGWDWSFMKNEEENHALVADEEAPTEFALMAKSSTDNEKMVKSSSSSKNEVFDDSFCSTSCKKNTEDLNTKITKLNEEIKKEKKGLESKLTGFESAAKDLDTLLQNDTITNYSRPSPSVESNSSDLQNSNSSVYENGESSESIMSNPMIKFIKAADSSTEVKTNKVEAARKPSVKYAEITSSVNRPNMNVAQPKRTSFAKPAHSYVIRPFHGRSEVRTQSQVPRVSIVCCCCSRQVNTAKPKAMINRRNWVNNVKASACWVWKPIKPNSASIILKRYDYVDVKGRSRSVMV